MSFLTFHISTARSVASFAPLAPPPPPLGVGVGADGAPDMVKSSNESKLAQSRESSTPSTAGPSYKDLAMARV